MWIELADIDHNQTSWVKEWHVNQPAPPDSNDLNSLHLQLCHFNFYIWHEEDKARDRDANDHQMALLKRKIDMFNQKRNDTIEAIDADILSKSPAPSTKAVLNSETPGSLVDRLFINALKIYHMAEIADDVSGEAIRRNMCRDRLSILREQRNDLVGCLRRLYDEIERGDRYCKIYRQMKMYNDEMLNPVLYSNTKKSID